MDESRKRFFTEQARIFKSLGHPNRLIMAEALAHGPLCVCDLRRLVGGDLSTISRHLSVLKEAGVVADEKRGKNIFYVLTLPCLDIFLRCTGEAVQGRLHARLHDLRAVRDDAAGRNESSLTPHSSS